MSRSGAVVASLLSYDCYLKDYSWIWDSASADLCFCYHCSENDPGLPSMPQGMRFEGVLNVAKRVIHFDAGMTRINTMTKTMMKMTEASGNAMEVVEV